MTNAPRRLALLIAAQAARFSGFMIAVPLLACSGAGMMRRFTPADADARSRAYIAQLQRKQVDSAALRFVPQLATSEAREQLTRVAEILGDREFDSSAVVGASVNTINGVRHTDLTYELHSPSSWVLANLATVDTAGSWLVEGFSARPLRRSLEEDSAFTMAGKSLLHYQRAALRRGHHSTRTGRAMDSHLCDSRRRAHRDRSLPELAGDERGWRGERDRGGVSCQSPRSCCRGQSSFSLLAPPLDLVVRDDIHDVCKPAFREQYEAVASIDPRFPVLVARPDWLQVQAGGNWIFDELQHRLIALLLPLRTQSLIALLELASQFQVRECA